jgi:hypothetical protein
MNLFKGLNFWRTIATLLLGMVIGMYVYHTFFDGQDDSIHIGKYKIKGKQKVEGNNNKQDQEQKGILDIFQEND